jgi:PST family polysaccharide transporter
VLAQVASQVVALGVLAVLYRLLGPEPYGLMGMVLPLFLLARILIAGGLDVATVQQQELADEQVAALFWVNLGLGVFMAAFSAAMAPVLVWFYGQRELLAITLVLAGAAILSALGTQHQALLQRKLRVGAVATIHLASQTIGGGLAILAAANGWGVWALVVQQYGHLVALGALLWAVEPFRPRRVSLRSGIGPLVRFGGQYTLSGLMFYLTANADKVLVGFALGPRALGLYSQAFNLMLKPVNVVITPLTGVMLPALSRAAARKDDYRRIALEFFRFIGLVMLPAGVGLSIVAPEAMRVLGGSQWAEAGVLLAALAPAILVQGFFNALGSVLASVGRADRLAVGSVAVAAVLCAAFGLGLLIGNAFGRPTLGVALSYSFGMLLVVFPPYLAFCFAAAGLSVGQWLERLRPAGLAAIGMGLLVAACHWALGWLPDGRLLAIEIAVGVGSYSLLARREIRHFVQAWTSRPPAEREPAD